MFIKKIAAAVVLCLMLTSGSQAYYLTIDQPTRQNLRVWITWDPSETGYNDSQREDLKQGVAMALSMWQSILPDLHWHWATSSADANCLLHVVSFGSNCNNTCLWSTTSVDINLMSRAGGRDLSFGAYTGISRDVALAAFVPGPWPPIHYGNPNYGDIGYIGGRFEINGGDPNWDAPLNEGNDVAQILFHEFGHSLGMYDNTSVSPPVFSVDDFIAAYGHPYVPGQSPPKQPGITVKSLPAPKQPSNNLAAWPPTGWPSFGGSTYFGCGTTSDALTNVGGVTYDVYNIYAQKGVSAFNKLSPIALIHNTNMPDNPTHYGLVSTGTSKWNKRVISGLDLNPTLMPDLPWTYPVTSGMICLNRADGTVALANNWYSAINKAQLNQLTQSNPYLVSNFFPECNNMKMVSAGASFSAALRADGKVYAWGDNAQGELGINSTAAYVTTPSQVSLSVPIRSIACGGEFMVMLDTAGKLWACGWNIYGMLGNNTTVANSKVPVAVGNISGQPCNGNKYVAIASGGGHCIALKEDGTIWGWGYNAVGQVGDGTTTDRYFPVQIGMENDWVAVYTGLYHSFGLKANGQLYAWGYNDVGQLGISNATSVITGPTTVAGSWKCISITQNSQSLGVKSDGTLWGWGLNNYHQVNGSGTNYYSPVQIGTDNNWISCNGGWDYSMALKQDGSIWAWGNNSDGIFLNNASSEPNPIKLTSPPASQVTQSFSCGQGHMIAWTNDGRIWTCGKNGLGQLGRNGTTSSNTISALTQRTTCITANSYAFPGSSVDLTNEGYIDWMIFDNKSPQTRKKTGSSISNYTLLKSGTTSSFSQNLSFNWTQDGPTNIDNNSTGSSKAGVQISGQNNGFRITVPTSLAARTLKLYCGVEKATAQLSASVSDGSSTFSSVNLTNTTGITYQLYAITFNAASTSKTLTVTWKNTSTTGNVKLIAATLR